MHRTLTCRILLSGGLGNQLFQYAFARSLALRSEAHLELDVESLFRVDRRYRRSYELGIFMLPGDIRLVRGAGVVLRLRRRIVMRLQRCRPFTACAYVDEPRPLRFYPEYARWRLERNVALTGYWQCSEYFRECADVLRADLQFRAPLPRAALAVTSRMESEPSVAVHVRRVGYGTTLGTGYYSEAMRRMRLRTPGARFYVFGDDPEWWRGHGDNGPDVDVVSTGGASADGDFRLMTHCRHFIIANSSYSWWAAWLGRHPEKQIIAPAARFWLNRDTVPVEWEPIDSN